MTKEGIINGLFRAEQFGVLTRNLPLFTIYSTTSKRIHQIKTNVEVNISIFKGHFVQLIMIRVVSSDVSVMKGSDRWLFACHNSHPSKSMNTCGVFCFHYSPGLEVSSVVVMPLWLVNPHLTIFCCHLLSSQDHLEDTPGRQQQQQKEQELLEKEAPGV
jgi:hypothetical protein